jgi:hypothetical protein
MKPATHKPALSSTHKHAMSQVDDDCMAKKQCKGAKTGVKGGEEEEKRKGKRALLGRFPPPVLPVADPHHRKTSTDKAMEVAAAAEPSKLTKQVNTI